MIILDFYNRTRNKISKKLFEKLLPAGARILRQEKKLGATARRIELTLIGNAAMRRLNRTHHNKDKPTDVISLSFFDASSNDEFAGEIFISVPYAKKQARKIGQPLTEELRFLFVHGLLHIFSYDHKKPREEGQMLQLAYSILGRHEGLRKFKRVL